MHFSSLLLTLAATVSAIDIRAHTGDGCSQGYDVCTNINPNVCCTFGGSKASVAFVAIPRNWRILCSAFTGGGCSFFGGERASDGNDFVCLPYTTRGDRTGGRYSFISRKRAIDQTCPAEQPNGGKCESSVEPDAVGLADGTEYNITGLSVEKVEEIRKIAATGAGAEAVPAEFQVLRRSL